MKFAMLLAVVCVLHCATLLSVTRAAPPAATNEKPMADSNGAKASKTLEVETAAAAAVAAPAAVADPAAADAGVAGAQRNQNARASPIVDYLTLLFSKIQSYCVPNGYFTIGTSFGSLDSCAQACLLRGDCASFVYNTGAQSCELKYAVSGHAFARYRYVNGYCITYYKRIELQVAPTSVSDGRTYYQYMSILASHDNATTYCRSRGLHVADIRTANERNAALNAMPSGSFWMNLYPAFSNNAAYHRYRDDAVVMSTYLASFAPSGLAQVHSTVTGYCAALHSANYYIAPDCMSNYYVVCQYSDLDRF